MTIDSPDNSGKIRLETFQLLLQQAVGSMDRRLETSQEKSILGEAVTVHYKGVYESVPPEVFMQNVDVNHITMAELFNKLSPGVKNIIPMKSLRYSVVTEDGVSQDDILASLGIVGAPFYTEHEMEGFRADGAKRGVPVTDNPPNSRITNQTDLMKLFSFDEFKSILLENSQGDGPMSIERNEPNIFLIRQPDGIIRMLVAARYPLMSVIQEIQMNECIRVGV
jgi:hypothetical protein